MNGGLWLAVPHSCQRRPGGPTSTSADSRWYSTPTLWPLWALWALWQQP